jgi:chitinase
MPKRALELLLALVLGAASCFAQSHWVTAYYAGWAKWNPTPVDIPQIDFTCATHWVLFEMNPTSSGTFDGTNSGIDSTRLRQFATAVHAAGKKAIIGTGGWGSDYTGAVTNAATSISFLTGIMKTYGFDGVDIDWEPVPPAQYANFSTWVQRLKAAMLAINPQATLTAAALGFDQGLVNSQQYIDQINMMTYDMSGPWPGWVSWHNSAIFDGGKRFPSTGQPMPSIDGSANAYLTAGIPGAKLGFGIEFYGYIWNGVSGPMQSGFGNVQNTIPYAQVMDTFGNLPLKWDAGAQASYYAAANQFVSFDAETTMAVKANYLKTKGLGGVILYEVAAAYRDNLPAGSKDRLLQAVKGAFMSVISLPHDSIPPSVQIVSPSNNVVLANVATVKASVTDNVSIAGVQFQIDGTPVGTELVSPPYVAVFNTRLFPNGPHTLTALARDIAGNTGAANIVVTIANSGTVQNNPSQVVFDDTLRAGFTNTSWGAAVDFSNTTPVSPPSTRSARVLYDAWGAFELLHGTWSNQLAIDVTRYDSLKFDVYSPAQISLTIGYYVGSNINVTVAPNGWHTIAVPLPLQPFSRFFIQSGAGAPATAYFDNVVLTGAPIATGGGGEPGLPQAYALEQNYPNPFNPSTTIRFSVPVGGHVSLIVYDILGNEVATLVNEERPAGTSSVLFDASSPGRGNGPLASGVYFYRLLAGSFSMTKRFLLLK